MNTGLSQSTLEELMKVVERAVRPLRAGRDRKLAMREELLAHLIASYQEEFSHAADASAAAAAAIKRFGDPREVSRELAASLTWRDGALWINERFVVLLDYTFGWQRGESFARFATRSGGALIALNLFLFAIVFAVARLRPDHFDPTFASFNRFTLALFAGMFAYELSMVWCIPMTARAMSAESAWVRWLVTAVNLAGWTVLAVVLSAAFWFGITLSVDSVMERLPRIALIATAALPPIFFTIAWLTAREQQRGESLARWNKLVVEECRI